MESEEKEKKGKKILNEAEKDAIRESALKIAFTYLQEKQIASGLDMLQHADICMLWMESCLPDEIIEMIPAENLQTLYWGYTKLGNASAIRQAAEKKGYLKKTLDAIVSKYA